MKNVRQQLAGVYAICLSIHSALQTTYIHAYMYIVLSRTANWLVNVELLWRLCTNDENATLHTTSRGWITVFTIHSIPHSC